MRRDRIHSVTPAHIVAHRAIPPLVPTTADRQYILGAALVASLGTFGMHLLLPSLPAIGREFAVPAGTTQLLVSLAMLAIAAGNLLVGPLSDRYGRRSVTLASLALFVAGSVLGIVAPTLEVLIAARVVQAFGGGAATAVVRATLTDRFGPERAASAIAYSAMAVLVVPMFAPTLGGLSVEAFGWRAPFALAAAIGVGIALYAWLRVAETHAPDVPLETAAAGSTPGRSGASAGAPLGTLASYRELLRTPAYVRYVLYGSCLMAAVYVFITGAPYVAIELYRVRPSEYGAWFVVPAVASFTGFLIAGRISRRRGQRWMMRAGLTLSLVGAVAVALPVAAGAAHAAALFLPAMLVCFSNALSTPNSTSAAIATRPDIAGAASGLLGFTQLLLSAAATQLVATFENGTAWPLAIAIGVLNVLALLTFRRIP